MESKANLLNNDQHIRVCALYEARQLLIGDDSLSDDIIKVAHYIMTGRLMADKYINITRPLPDAATWNPENVRH